MAISKAGKAILERQARVAAINAFAIREGWFIANENEIQADDSDDIERGFKLLDDQMARCHVAALARDGSALHSEALELVKP